MSTPQPELPAEIPLFPLPGVLLLPRGELPLHIFEPRYLAMIDDALRGDRMIGMIQPRQHEGENNPLFNIGCAGKITSFTETADNRYFVTLTGVSRFTMAAELPQVKGYRRAQVRWEDFQKDTEPAGCLDLDRAQLKTLLEAYFDQHAIACDWSHVDEATDEKLINCLSMICPFDPAEKQALLEAGCCRGRAQKFMAMLEMAVKAGGCCGGHCH
ncbi:MAG: LON peptidase substrate-binding domain-containing protein [Alphaproteobacteria bacterium]|nr:LON peptidase substrate-binding domain-containing protein [Alphaproteobacteria bacterium]MBU0859636.1 LON peptidase substrate-binding domain-containing protein [Alphaproteobacteria bacterium]